MLKREELADPNSCLNKAGDDEPLFVILGRDEAAAATIRFWVGKRISLGKNKPDDDQIRDAMALAKSIEADLKATLGDAPAARMAGLSPLDAQVAAHAGMAIGKATNL